ncbi:ISWI chromatin-remodeling complex ATPase ISW2 [Diplonema papillatum]|nr:ISWI chromatin-remodeling complex ATPase ISW2 [Diplonema papillatum]|eukprot:gene5597-8526_t
MAVRKRPDGSKKPDERAAADAKALKEYKRVLLLRSDSKLALSEGVKEIRNEALKTVKIPAVDAKRATAAAEADFERTKKIGEARNREVRDLQAALRKRKRLGSVAGIDRFEALMEQCYIFTKSATSVTHSPQPVRPLRKQQAPASPGSLERHASKLDEFSEEEDGSSDDDAPTASGVLTTHPAYLAGNLRRYQIDGVNWLLQLHRNCLSGILADEMGLGKTFQTIALLSYLKYSLFIPGPHLVICPRSVLGNWNRECARWSPGLNVFMFHGVGDERRPLKKKLANWQAAGYDVVLSTWEQVTIELSVFKKIPFRYLILDEGHKIKNDESTISNTVRQLRSTNRLLLTGTPLQNNLKELWALLNFLLPTLFRDATDFDQWFDAAAGSADDDVMNKLHHMLRPFMLRRIKEEADTAIPPKKEVYVSCRLTELQRKWYQNVLARELDVVNATGKTVGTKNVKNIIMHLRKVCCHPYLFEGAEPGPPYKAGEHTIRNCGKMIILDKLLHKLFEQAPKRGQPGDPKKVLIFSQMTAMLNVLEDYLNFRGWKYCRLDGSTSGEDRDMQMNDFNSKDTDKKIFLLSTRAGGLGINLQTASTVVMYDSDWNPQADLQAMDRAHRIGQKYPVSVYRFITDGTVEEKIYQRAMKKLYLDAIVVQQGNMAPKQGTMSVDELQGMVRWGAAAVFKQESASDEELMKVDIDEIIKLGAKQAKDMKKDLESSQQNSLRNFKLGVDEANMYEFDGVDYTTNPTKQLFFEGKSFNPEALEAELRAAGPVTRFIMSTELDRAAVTFRVLDDAIKAKKTFDGKKLGGSKQPVAVHYGSKAQVISGELKAKIDERIAAEEAERKKSLAQARPEAHGGGAASESDGGEEEAVRIPKYKRKPPRQLFDNDRLEELHDIEFQMRVEAKASGKEFAFPENLRAERERLLEEGFADWSQDDLNKFINATARYGEGRPAKVAAVLGKPVDVVARYEKAFWARGPSMLERFELHRNRIAKHQEAAKKAEVAALATKEYLSKFDNLWTPTWPKPTGLPEAPSDRYLMGFAVQHDENMEAVHNRLMSTPELFYDLNVHSRTPSSTTTRYKNLQRRFTVVPNKGQQKRKREDEENEAAPPPEQPGKDAAPETKAKKRSKKQ